MSAGAGSRPRFISYESDGNEEQQEAEELEDDDSDEEADGDVVEMVEVDDAARALAQVDRVLPAASVRARKRVLKGKPRPRKGIAKKPRTTTEQRAALFSQYGIVVDNHRCAYHERAPAAVCMPVVVQSSYSRYVCTRQDFLQSVHAKGGREDQLDQEASEVTEAR